MKLIQAVRRSIAVRQKRLSLPRLFLPITRGPLQNFYHFFTGYFVPLFWERYQHPEEKVAVMDCPPYTRWFEILPGTPPKILDQGKAMKHAYLADRAGYAHDYKVEAFLGWDKWERFSSRPLRKIASAMRESIDQRLSKDDSTKTEVLFLGRDHTPEFFADNLPGRYGTAKRNIPNLSELAGIVGEIRPTEIVDGAALSPEEMISRCSLATAVVGQHGAALTNIFFLAPGAKVIEIIWPEFKENSHAEIYGLLAGQLGLNYQQLVLQDGPFGVVDPRKLLEAIPEIRRL